ncbi:uncharacterized protein LOC122053622 [Zingiber officinale]|uniref:uncharacterized protein LOC122053622 n=1 Tax=Zingiber officinale TaxID=94328 RepID=UPI001C4D39E5|nr:uncharacterized protein LOC122053622 [Zingiber officinale]
MEGEAVPTEGSAVKPDGSREDTGSSLESIKSEKWTNEKHTLYLRTLETSFLDQLCNSEKASSDLLGSLPLVAPKPTRKLGSITNFFHLTCQFEFPGRRSQNFASKRAQFEMKKEIKQLFKDPWIQRFTSRGTLNRVDSNVVINLAMPSSNTSPNHKQADSSHIPRQHHEEVSDQNFDNIKHEGQSDAQATNSTKDHTENPAVKDSSST